MTLRTDFRFCKNGDILQGCRIYDRSNPPRVIGHEYYRVVRRGIIFRAQALRIADWHHGEIWRDFENWAVVRRIPPNHATSLDVRFADLVHAR
jgi:hypothetical protein